LQTQAFGKIAGEKPGRLDPFLQAAQHSFDGRDRLPKLAGNVGQRAAQPARRLQRPGKRLGDARFVRFQTHGVDQTQDMRDKAGCGGGLFGPVTVDGKGRLPARQPFGNLWPGQHDLRIFGRQVFQMRGQPFGIGAQDLDRGCKRCRQRQPLSLLDRNPGS